MTKQELYEATRGVWRVSSKRREHIDIAMAVYQGIVLEVYEIQEWHPAGTLEYQTRNFSKLDIYQRSEFVGIVSEVIRNEYVGFNIGKSGPNPIRYING